jgi:hypothetical protein
VVAVSLVNIISLFHVVVKNKCLIFNLVLTFQVISQTLQQNYIGVANIV